MSLKLFIFVACTFLPTLSWRFKKYPYADLSFEEKVEHDGYPMEQYQVTTEDNYILTIYRIPHGRKSQNVTNRSPVLLLHGMGGSPEMFVLLGTNRSLAYNLADSGFDVWFLNARGCVKSRDHKYYNLDKDSEYWDFSFHEVAINDVSANIDFVTNKTKQKVFLIGHSQGNTCFFILLSVKPEYNRKVKMAVAYAPAVRIHLDNPFVTVLLYITEVFQGLYKFLNLQEVVPYFPNSTTFIRNLCKEQTYIITLCFHLMSIVASNPSKIMEKDLIPIIAGTIHSRISAKQVFQYMQNVRAGVFGQFNYGPMKNMQIYGNATPPLYDLKKVTAPTAIFYGKKDEIISVKGARETIKQLPNVHFYLEVENEHFNHLDFLFGKNSSELVYQKTVKLFQDFDNKL